MIFTSTFAMVGKDQSERFSSIKQEVWNTYRDPKKAPFHWKESLSFDKIVKIQEKCQNAMKFWGYEMVTEADLSTKNWNPLSQWQINAENLK